MTIILGPVPCKSCRRPVVYDGWGWVEPEHPGRGYPHRCAKAKAA